MEQTPQVPNNGAQPAGWQPDPNTSAADPWRAPGTPAAAGAAVPANDQAAPVGPEGPAEQPTQQQAAVGTDDTAVNPAVASAQQPSAAPGNGAPSAAYGAAGTDPYTVGAPYPTTPYETTAFGPVDSGTPAGPGSTDGKSRRRGMGLVAAALVAGLVGGGVGAGITAAVEDNNTSNTPVTSSLDSKSSSNQNASAQTLTGVEQVAATVLPSVVSISEQGQSGSGTGSGVIISSDGLILTNNHVVAGAANGGSLSVTFKDGSTADASIVGRDPLTDLAVIKAKGKSGLTVAQLGNSGDLKVGQQVVAIGSPLGLAGTVTTGIVSALDRPVSTQGEGQQSSNTVIDAIQTDAAINPGNSGGALVDMSGRVIGINSAIASLGQSLGGGQSGSIGLGFAIPIDQARSVATQLKDSGKATHARLGVSVGDNQDGNGAAIQSVTSGGAADKAGLKQGDVVTKIDDRAIDDADSLVAAVRSHQPGDKVTLTVTRGGSDHTVTATLESDGGNS